MDTIKGCPSSVHKYLVLVAPVVFHPVDTCGIGIYMYLGNFKLKLYLLFTSFSTFH